MKISTQMQSQSLWMTTALLYSFLSLLTLSEAALSQGCTHPHKSPIDWRPKANESRIFSVGHDPKNPREIRVHVPPKYNESAVMLPLLLAFHDKDMSTAEMEYQSRLSDPAANDEFIVVYPTAKNNAWQSDISVRRWQKKEPQQKNVTDDVAFITQLLNDLDTIICFDDSRIHAVGMGTGAGMVHLMACDSQLSTRVASFATVAGGYGHPSKADHWAKCFPARLPIPIMSIHGDEDKVLPYLLNEWEPAKSRWSVPTWLEAWSEKNGCGEAIGDSQNAMDATGTAVTVTKLEGGGWMSEGEAFGGGTWRMAKSCPKPNSKDTYPTKKEEKEEIPLEVKSTDGEPNGGGGRKEEILTSNPADFTILHYRVHNYGHGWPTLQIKGSGPGKKVSRFFDATDLVLDWFKIHEMPIEWAGEKPKREDVADAKDKYSSKSEMKMETKEESITGEVKSEKETSLGEEKKNAEHARSENHSEL
ncbi:hypothetical protein EJ08DRAFT_277260 [Tothia fuscella]|uniref:feruloyl esterase n=1 Tax=Tothia fuscella TaxID=1048955 RepID=A0A9P4NQ16_9PEZI|nr:hypothetical protein EJ08DRAFT_277260 [Tothia fuscella]